MRNTASDLVNLLFASRAKRKLALLRVHKTGSKSFRTALRKSYLQLECSPLEYSTTVTAKALEGKSFISPHLALAQWQALEGAADWVVAVTMREPRARLRSAFRYFKGKRGSNPLQVGELLANMDYRDFLLSDHPVLIGLKDNVLTRFLGGGQFGTQTETRNQLYLPEGLELQTAELAASDNLKTGLVLPLILENRKDSISALCRVIGVNRVPAIGWQNRTTDGAQIAVTPEIAALEEAFVGHDVRVYAEAVKRLS